MSRALVLGVLGALALLSGCHKAPPRVVLYCAQDEEFAEGVLHDFTERSGLEVAPKYDTEAQKSISLYQELVQEKARPRCDVYWNNEIIYTILLQRQGLLEPYASPSAAAYPAWTKPKDQTWQAFAARARILVVNTQLVKEADRPRSLFDLTDPRWKGKAAMAKPVYGTSATQAACLFEVLGREKAKQYYQDLRKNDIHVVSGNKQVAEGVGQGQLAVGVTDTDDAIAEVEAGRPVAIIFPDGDRPQDERMGTLFIPNTLALVRGGPDPANARRLIDYLLSPEVEGRLAEAASHQIPLNPEVKARLPKEIQTPKDVKAMQVDFEKAADVWEEVQQFLAAEFARQ